MAQSNPDDFEFDISDLEVEEPVLPPKKIRALREKAKAESETAPQIDAGKDEDFVLEETVSAKEDEAVVAESEETRNSGSVEGKLSFADSESSEQTEVLADIEIPADVDLESTAVEEIITDTEQESVEESGRDTLVGETISEELPVVDSPIEPEEVLEPSEEEETIEAFDGEPIGSEGVEQGEVHGAKEVEDANSGESEDSQIESEEISDLEEFSQEELSTDESEEPIAEVSPQIEESVAEADQSEAHAAPEAQKEAFEMELEADPDLEVEEVVASEEEFAGKEISEGTQTAEDSGSEESAGEDLSLGGAEGPAAEFEIPADEAILSHELSRTDYPEETIEASPVAEGIEESEGVNLDEPVEVDLGEAMAEADKEIDAIEGSTPESSPEPEGLDGGEADEQQFKEDVDDLLGSLEAASDRAIDDLAEPELEEKETEEKPSESAAEFGASEDSRADSGASNESLLEDVLADSTEDIADSDFEVDNLAGEAAEDESQEVSEEELKAPAEEAVEELAEPLSEAPQLEEVPDTVEDEAPLEASSADAEGFEADLKEAEDAGDMPVVGGLSEAEEEDEGDMPILAESPPVPELDEALDESLVNAGLEIPKEDENEPQAEVPSADDLLVQAGSILNGGELPSVEEASEDGEGQVAEPKEEVIAPAGLEILEEAENVEEELPVPSADDLLKQAGSILNGGDTPSLEEVEDSFDEQKVEESEPKTASDTETPGLAVMDDDEEEIMAMPDPAALMEVAAEGEDEETITAMPDPMDLMSGASEEAKTEDEKSEAGNVADRAGELPPPPPAPIAIDDDDEEELEEGAENTEEAEVLEANPVEPEATAAPALDVIEEEEDNVTEGISGDDSLDGFNTGLDEAEAFENELAEEATEDSSGEGEDTEKRVDKSDVVVELPKPSLFRRIAYSATWAAGFLIMGLAWLAFEMKQEIVELAVGQDLDASSLSREVQFVANHVLDGMNEDGLYRMKSVETKIKKISDSEIRLHSKVYAQLNRSLYLPVRDEEYLFDLPASGEELEEAKAYAEELSPDLLEMLPKKDWNSLYRLAVPKYKVVPMRVTYRLLRDGENGDWALTDILSRGEDGEEIEWPSGVTIDAFGDLSLNADSLDFQERLSEYREGIGEFMEGVAAHQNLAAADRVRRERELATAREELMASLGTGSFFQGLAIAGEQSDRTHDVTMVITETRERGSIVKGVFQISEQSTHSKHFTGFIDFEENKSGDLDCILNLTTIAFEGERSGVSLPPFFNPGTVSRIELKSDGYKVEGDSPGLSLRMIKGSEA
ncbi:MAG: hypothetical protein AAGB46_11100 [Verrucomicrobiota bacterium]